MQGIHWSTSSVLQDSISQAHDLGLSCAAMLPSLQDVDTLQVERQRILYATMFDPLASQGALLCSALHETVRRCPTMQDLRTWLGTSSCMHPLHKQFKELLNTHKLLT